MASRKTHSPHRSAPKIRIDMHRNRTNEFPGRCLGYCNLMRYRIEDSNPRNWKMWRLLTGKETGVTGPAGGDRVLLRLWT